MKFTICASAIVALLVCSPIASAQTYSATETFFENMTAALTAEQECDYLLDQTAVVDSMDEMGITASDLIQGGQYYKDFENVVSRIHILTSTDTGRQSYCERIRQNLSAYFERIANATNDESPLPRNEVTSPTKDDGVDEKVQSIQQRLVQLGYDVGGVDGVFGRNTKRAITEFQADQGYTNNGEVSDVLQQRLELAVVTNKSDSGAEQQKSNLNISNSDKDRVVDYYHSSIAKKVRRKWNRPVQARGPVSCTVRVVQMPGGELSDVSVSDCSPNSDAIKTSVELAVWKSNPLPAAPSSSLFEPELDFDFQVKGL